MPTASLSSSSASILISSSLASPILSLKNIKLIHFVALLSPVSSHYFNIFIAVKFLIRTHTHAGVSKWVTCLKSIGFIKLFYSESKSRLRIFSLSLFFKLSNIQITTLTSKQPKKQCNNSTTQHHNYQDIAAQPCLRLFLFYLSLLSTTKISPCVFWNTQVKFAISCKY